MFILMLEFSIIVGLFVVFFFKQKTAYEMRISDWSSDVCSSDLPALAQLVHFFFIKRRGHARVGIHRKLAAARITEKWQGDVVAQYDGIGCYLVLADS